MGVDEIIVTWARTRGSTMKFFPVAAATEIRRNAPGLLCGCDGHHREQHRRAADKVTKTLH
jgi:hypothetical protein